MEQAAGIFPPFNISLWHRYALTWMYTALKETDKEQGDEIRNIDRIRVIDEKYPA